MGRVRDLTGQHFGNLIAIKKIKSRMAPGGGAYSVWECKCKCGRSTNVEMYSLVNGYAKGCGHCIIDSFDTKEEVTNPLYNPNKITTITCFLIAIYDFEGKSPHEISKTLQRPVDVIDGLLCEMKTAGTYKKYVRIFAKNNNTRYKRALKQNIKYG